MMWLPDGGKKSSILSHFDRKPDGRTDGEMTQADLNASFFSKKYAIWSYAVLCHQSTDVGGGTSCQSNYRGDNQ